MKKHWLSYLLFLSICFHALGQNNYRQEVLYQGAMEQGISQLAVEFSLRNFD